MYTITQKKKKFYIKHPEPLQISAYNIVQWSVTTSSGRPLSADRHTNTDTLKSLVTMGLNGSTIFWNVLKTVFDHKTCWKSVQQNVNVCTTTGCDKQRRIFFNAKEPQLSGPGWLSCDQTLLQFELRLTFFGSRLPSQGSLKKFRKGGSFGCKTVKMRYWGPKFSCFKLLSMQPS